MAAEMAHMLEVQDVVDEFLTKDQEEAITFASQIYSFITKTPNASILTLVEALSKALTHENVGTRQKGTKLLTEYVCCCRAGDLNDQENETLVLFLCDRLQDHHSIQPLVIYGMLGLISHQDINKQLVIRMLQAIFAEVHVQSLTHTDRRNVFNLFRVLLESKLDVLKSFNTDFVLGFIQAMDSERDPRNLLVCFGNAYIVLTELDISLYAEDFFEILSCYFPIDFKPPKENPHGITNDDLVLSLRRCLTCTSAFTPYVIPLYMEKLSSDLVDTKVDTLITFTDSLKVSKPDHVTMFTKEVWTQVRKDFLLSEIQETHELYLKFMEAFVSCILKAKNMEPLDEMVGLFIKDCLLTLKDPEMTIAKQCAEIIYVISNLSLRVFQQILDNFLQPIETSLSKYSSTLQRSSLLEIVHKILQVKISAMENNNGISVMGSNDVTSYRAPAKKNKNEITATENNKASLMESKDTLSHSSSHCSSLAKLKEFVDKHLSILFSYLSCDQIESKLQILSVKCLCEIAKRHSFYVTDMELLCRHVFKDNFLFSNHSPLHEDVLKELSSLIESLSLSQPESIQSHFINVVSTKISIDHRTTTPLEQSVPLLASCCVSNFDVFGVNILSFLVQLILQMVTDRRESLFEIVKKTCCTVLDNSNHDNIDADIVFLPLLRSLFSIELPTKQFLDGFISTLISSYRKLSTPQQKDVTMTSYKIITKSNVPSWLPTIESINQERFLQIASILSTSCVSQAEYDTLLTLDLMNLLNVLWELMKGNSGNELVLEHVGMCIGSLLNKEISLTEQACDLIAAQSMTSDGSNGAAILFLAWVTKGCVLNWRHRTKDFLEHLVKELNDPKNGRRAAQGFEILTRSEENVLTKKSHAVVKVMYKQRFSQLVLPLLMTSYHSSAPDVKAFVITAISCTLRTIPKQLLQRYLKELIPMLLHSLATFHNDDIILSTLTTVSMVTEANKELMEPHSDTLTSRLISLISHARMNVRVLALKTLTRVSTFTSYRIVSLRRDVLRSVRLALDDKKRLVRKEATSCSNAWHLVAS